MSIIRLLIYIALAIYMGFMILENSGTKFDILFSTLIIMIIYHLSEINSSIGELIACVRNVVRKS